MKDEDKKSIKNTETSQKELLLQDIRQIKEELFYIYLETKEFIINKRIEMTDEEFLEKLNTIKLSNILVYLKESIRMIIQKSINYMNEKNAKKDRDNKIDEKNIHLYYNELENQIIKLESKLKFYIQKDFQNQINKDALELKIKCLLRETQEFEELKEKVRYQEGKFLNNDRKDNEILILRQENSNIKKDIALYEKQINELNIKNTEFAKNNKSLKLKINELSKKIKKLQLEKDDYNNKNNSNINININNNGNSLSNLYIQKDDKNSCKHVSKNKYQLKSEIYEAYDKNIKLNSEGKRAFNFATNVTNHNIFNTKPQKLLKIYKPHELTVDYEQKTDVFNLKKANKNYFMNHLVINKDKKMNRSNSVTVLIDETSKKHSLMNTKSEFNKSDKKLMSFKKVLKNRPNLKFPITNKNYRDYNPRNVSQNNLRPNNSLGEIL